MIFVSYVNTPGRDKKLDLNEYRVKPLAVTFFVKAEGDSMINAGIHSGDILVADKSTHVMLI
jgi:DNA polymerase V